MQIISPQMQPQLYLMKKVSYVMNIKVFQLSTH